LYRVDDDGYFWYEGRTDDLIVSAGYKISAIEIEAALMSHPKVAECAVIGAPSEERGAIVKAFVVVKGRMPADDVLRHELQDYVKLQIAPYKYPRAIEFVTELPHTSTGKLQRSRLREQERQKRIDIVRQLHGEQHARERAAHRPAQDGRHGHERERTL